jgi:4-cresol dehydrogenase (hydroxylating)
MNSPEHRTSPHHDWTALLGTENIIFNRDLTSAAETATFATHQSIPFILRPANREQVQECLRIANRLGVPLYPVSSGKNWGYGSRVPVADSCALLDLGRMDRIVDFNEELAYVTVEPGVTQRHLHQFLRERHSKLWMDATGSSPDCSLIGNAMERGFGHTPYSDHFAHVCGFEVVLPSGECIHTGFARFPGARTGPLYRWGVGPSLDGLFTQSNLGIVTRMSIWLMPAPEYVQAFFFRCGEDSALSRVIDALRPLRLDGTLRSAIHVANDYKVLAGIQQFPWQSAEPPLSRGKMEGFRKKLQFGRWNGSGALYGTRAQVAEARRLVRKALAGKVDKLKFLDERTMRMAARFAKPYRRITGWDLARTMQLVKPVFGLMQGVPTEKTLTSAYWRKRTPAPASMDLDRDRCGLLWCAPVLPLDGEEAAQVADLTETLMLAHGFEPFISLTLLTERTLAAIISITYDRDVPGEDRKAMECYRNLMDRLTQRGYHSYRLGIQSMAAMNGGNEYSRLIESLKQMLDPNGVLAPGRYQMRVPHGSAANLVELPQRRRL